jgi:hypothetical protein
VDEAEREAAVDEAEREAAEHGEKDLHESDESG